MKDHGYTVYCDESRHDGSPRNLYMAIGGLWVPTDQKADLTKDLRVLLAKVGFGSEVKWSKVSDKRLEDYKKLIDFFFDREMNFRVIVVEQARLDYEKFKDGDSELGFYTFYYEMLIKWLDKPVSYNILLDFKKNKSKRRHTVLGECLARSVAFHTRINGPHVIDSAESPLAQINDMLTGAVAAAWSGFSGSTAKARLADYIARKNGWSNLRNYNRNAEFCKLNVFKIDLQ